MRQAVARMIPGRRRVLLKFREGIITDKTKWVVEKADFTGLMNEFKYEELVREPVHKTSLSQPRKSGKVDKVKEFF
jgi:hypothetical protein